MNDCMNECANACKRMDEMNDHASENKVRMFGKVTLMTQVMGLRSSYRICPNGICVCHS